MKSLLVRNVSFTFLKGSCFGITQKIYSRKIIFGKVQAAWINLLLLIFLNLSKAIFRDFRVWQGNNDLNLISQNQACIPGKCHAMSLIIFFTKSRQKLWKCYHATINNQHLTCSSNPFSDPWLWFSQSCYFEFIYFSWH